MKRMPFKRPTTHYDEKITQIDEKICELIKQRKDISNNNPGYPPLEYISEWAEKFNLYEDLLKSIFGSLWNEELHKPIAEPEEFIKNVPVLKSIEIDGKLFSINTVRQYSNASVVNFNVDWNDINESEGSDTYFPHYELYIGKEYTCRMDGGSGSCECSTHKFIISPPLPDNFSGIKLTFREYEPPFRDTPIGSDIVIEL